MMGRGMVCSDCFKLVLCMYSHMCMTGEGGGIFRLHGCLFQ